MKEEQMTPKLFNDGFNRATTKMFWSIDNPELGASENVILT